MGFHPAWTFGFVIVTRCDITAKVGRFFYNIFSLSSVKPPSPRNLTATNIKKRKLSIEWEHPLFRDSYDVKHYVIKYKEFGNSWQKIEIDGKQVNMYILEDLEAGTKYSIQTHAVNHLGEGLPSNVVETETLSGKWTLIMSCQTANLDFIEGGSYCCPGFGWGEGRGWIASLLLLVTISLFFCRKRWSRR